MDGFEGGWGGVRGTVLEVHLHGRAIGRFADPYVEIFALSRFKEEDVVAVVELGEFVELVELGFGVELRIFAAMGEERVEIVEKMSMSVGDSARGEDEDSLLGSCGDGCRRGGVFGSCGFGEGLVDGSHACPRSLG